MRGIGIFSSLSLWSLLLQASNVTSSSIWKWNGNSNVYTIGWVRALPYWQCECPDLTGLDFWICWPNFMILHFKTPPTQFGVCLTEPGAGLFCPSVHWVLRRLRSTWLRRCTRLVCRVAEVFDPLQKGEAKLLDSLLWLPGFFVLPSM